MIPDNDTPVDFSPVDMSEDEIRKMIKKQSKRRGSLPVNPKVRRRKTRSNHTTSMISRSHKLTQVLNWVKSIVVKQR